MEYQNPFETTYYDESTKLFIIRRKFGDGLWSVAQQIIYPDGIRKVYEVLKAFSTKELAIKYIGQKKP